MKKIFQASILACVAFFGGVHVLACGESENVKTSQSEVVPTYYAYSYTVTKHYASGWYFAENKDKTDFVTFTEMEIRIGDNIKEGDKIIGLFDKDDNLISIEKNLPKG